jgi:hypothetical protein
LDRSSLEWRDLFRGELDLCADMRCPTLVKPPGCTPAQCKRLDDERKRRGAIYLIRPDGTDADFVGLLPRIKKRNAA